MADTQVQPKIIQVPSIGNIQFPGDMPDDQISAAIQKNYPQLATPNAGLAGVAQPKVDMQPLDNSDMMGNGTPSQSDLNPTDAQHPVVASALKRAGGLVKGTFDTIAQPPKGKAEISSMLLGPAGPIATRLVRGQVDASKQAAKQAADYGAQVQYLTDEKGNPVTGMEGEPISASPEDALQDARSKVSLLSAMNPLAAAPVSNVNRLENEGKPKEALGEGLADALTLGAGLHGPTKAIGGAVKDSVAEAGSGLSSAAKAVAHPLDVPVRSLSNILGGGPEAMAKKPLPGAPAAGSASNAEVAQYAKSKGIDLLPGQATQAKGLQTVQAVGERTIVAPGELPERLDQQKAAFGNLVDDFKQRVGTEAIPDTEAAGTSLKSQAQSGLDNLKQSAQADYQGFQQHAGDIPVDLSDVKAKAAASLASQAEALKNVPAQYANPVRNVLKKLSDLQAGGEVDPKALADFNNAVDTYRLNPEQQAALRTKLGLPDEKGNSAVKMSTAQQLRSAYLDISRDYTGNVPKSVQRYAGQAAKDIDAAMSKAADQVGATDQWRQANAKWKQLQQTYNNPEHPLYKVLQEPDPSKVPSRLLGKGSYGGSPQTVRQLQQAGIDISPLKREVAQQIADKNFSLTNGGRGLAGYSTEFLKTLFAPEEFDELTKMGRVGRAIKFEMNPSGTSNVMEGRHQIMGIIHGTLGATVGPLASRLTTSKALARATMGDISAAPQPRGLLDILGSKGPEPPPDAPPSGASPVTPPSGPAAPPAAAIPERRADLATRKTVAAMSPEERAQALLTSDKTGLPNRRAFDESQPAKAVAMSDADGLKAINDKFGYGAGDALLKAKADALKEAGLDAYHEKGDEFLYRGDSPADLKVKLDNARDILRNKTISVEMQDGSVLQFKGADFSYGTGKDLSTAETGLKANKSQREASGERARGELRGITQLGSQPGEENISGTAKANLSGNNGQDQQNPVAQRSLSDILSGKKPSKKGGN